MGLELCPEIKQLSSQCEFLFLAADKLMPNVQQNQVDACFLNMWKFCLMSMHLRFRLLTSIYIYNSLAVSMISAVVNCGKNWSVASGRFAVVKYLSTQRSLCDSFYLSKHNML
jgi:hypothetical protein